MKAAFTRARALMLAVPLLLGGAVAWQSQADAVPKQNTQKHSFVCVDHSDPAARAAAKDARRQARVEGNSRVKFVDDHSRHCDPDKANRGRRF